MSARRVQTGSAEAAVEEVNAAVTKLHLEVESLKSLKTALLKQTASAAMAAALAAKHQQAAQAVTKGKRLGRKRSAEAAALDAADGGSSTSDCSTGGSDDDSENRTAAAGGSKSSTQQSCRPVEDVCGPTWRLFQALSLQCLPAATSSTQPQLPAQHAEASAPAAAEAAAATGHGVPNTSTLQQQQQEQPQAACCPPATPGVAAAGASPGCSSVAAGSLLSLQQLTQRCLQQISSSSSSAPDFPAVHKALTHAPTVTTTHMTASEAPAHQHASSILQLTPNLDQLLDEESTAAAPLAASGGTGIQLANRCLPSDDHAAGLAGTPAHEAAPPGQPASFSFAAMLQHFEQQHQANSSQHHGPAGDAAISLIAGRFMLLSTAAADPMGPGLSQSTAAAQGMPLTSTAAGLVDQLQAQGEPGEVGLPSYMQQVIQQQPAQAHGGPKIPAAGPAAAASAADTAAGKLQSQGAATAATPAEQTAPGPTNTPAQPACMESRLQVRAGAGLLHASTAGTHPAGTGLPSEEQLVQKSRSTGQQQQDHAVAELRVLLLHDEQQQQQFEHLLLVDEPAGSPDLDPRHNEAWQQQQQQEPGAKLGSMAADMPSQLHQQQHQHAPRPASQPPAVAAAAQAAVADRAQTASAASGSHLLQQLHQLMTNACGDETGQGGSALLVLGLEEGPDSALGTTSDVDCIECTQDSNGGKDSQQDHLAATPTAGATPAPTVHAASQLTSPQNLSEAAGMSVELQEPHVGRGCSAGNGGRSASRLLLDRTLPAAALEAAAAAATAAGMRDSASFEGSSKQQHQRSLSADAQRQQVEEEEQQEQQLQQQEEVEEQQEQQQRQPSRVVSRYVPRFTKRKHNYHQLVDSLQQAQQQQQQLQQTEQGAAVAGACSADDGSDGDDVCMIEEVDGAEPEPARLRIAGTAPLLSRRGLSTSISKHPVPPAVDATGAAVFGAAAAAGGDAGGSSRPVLPLLKRRAAAVAAAAPGDSSSHQQPVLPAATVERPGVSSSSDDRDEIEDSGSDSNAGQQQQQVHAVDGAEQATGYRGRVPALGRRKHTGPGLSQQPTTSNSRSHTPSAGSGASISSDSWDGSADHAAAATDSDSDFWEYQTPKAAAKAVLLQPNAAPKPGIGSARSKGKKNASGAGATVATNFAAGAAAGKQDAVLLLQPTFRPSSAWQYSSSNLLRLSNSWGKRRFKPVVRAEALLKPPAVPLKQLGHGMATAGRLQVPEASTAGGLLKLLLGDQHYQQHYGPAAHATTQPPQQQPPCQHPLQQQQQHQQQPGSSLPPPASAAVMADAAAGGGDAVMDDDDFDDLDWAAVDALEAQHTSSVTDKPVGWASVAAAVGAGPAPAGVLPMPGADPGCAADGAPGFGLTTALADLRSRQQWRHQQQQGASWEQQSAQHDISAGPGSAAAPSPGCHQLPVQLQVPVDLQHGQQQQQQQHLSLHRQQQQQQQQDPITMALAGLLGLSDGDEADAAEAQPHRSCDAAAAAAYPPAAYPPAAAAAAAAASGENAAQPEQQQELIVTGLFDEGSTYNQQHQQQPTPWRQQQQQPWQQQQQGWQLQASHSCLGLPGGGATHGCHVAMPAAPAGWPRAPQSHHHWQHQAPMPPVHQQLHASTHQHQQVYHHQQQDAHYQQQQVVQRQQQVPNASEAASQLLSQFMEAWADEEEAPLDVVMEGDDDTLQPPTADEADAAAGWDDIMLLDTAGDSADHPAAAAAAGWAKGSLTGGQPGIPASYSHSQPGALQFQGSAAAAFAAGFNSSPGCRQTGTQGLGTQSGLSQLQLLHDELQDLACQLVFLDECDAADGSAAHTSAAGSTADISAGAAAAADAAVGAVGAAVAAQGDLPGSLLGSCQGQDGPQEAGLVAGDAAVPEGDCEGCMLVESCTMEAEDSRLHSLPSGCGTDPQQQQQQQDAQRGGTCDAGPAADDGSHQHAPGTDSSSDRRGALRACGLGSRSKPFATLAHMNPAERAAWVAAAKQRQQQLYERFIELALQGQQAAAVGGHQCLQHLMQLVWDCIREELESSKDRAEGARSTCSEADGRAAVSSAADGSADTIVTDGDGDGDAGKEGRLGRGCSSSRKGRDGGGTGCGAQQALNVMQLIRRVQLRHQQLLLEQQQGKVQQQGAEGRMSFAAAAGQAGTAPMVAQQRLFVAFLNVAHQNNLAAATRAAGTGAAPEVSAKQGPPGAEGGCTPEQRQEEVKRRRSAWARRGVDGS